MENDNRDGMRTVDQAARFLGISSHSVRRLVQRGELPSCKYLGRVMFKPEDLAQFVSDHTVEV